MARLPRLSIAKQLHLLVHRAKGDRPVLWEPRDLDAYLACLQEASAAEAVSIHAFALTTREVRLLVTPQADVALSAMLQSIGRKFVPAFNRRHDRRGPLWDGRFRATVVEPEAHFVACLKFVEMSPVRCGLVERAEDWPWSSASHHGGKRRIAGLTEHPLFWRIGNTPFEREANYRQVLESPLDESDTQMLQRAVLQGWVLGSAAFIESMASLAPRRISPLRCGRKPLVRPANNDLSLK
jgi:putative transposase